MSFHDNEFLRFQLTTHHGSRVLVLFVCSSKDLAATLCAFDLSLNPERYNDGSYNGPDFGPDAFYGARVGKTTEIRIDHAFMYRRSDFLSALHHPSTLKLLAIGEFFMVHSCHAMNLDLLHSVLSVCGDCTQLSLRIREPEPMIQVPSQDPVSLPNVVLAEIVCYNIGQDQQSYLNSLYQIITDCQPPRLYFRNPPVTFTKGWDRLVSPCIRKLSIVNQSAQQFTLWVQALLERKALPITLVLNNVSVPSGMISPMCFGSVNRLKTRNMTADNMVRALGLHPELERFVIWSPAITDSEVPSFVRKLSVYQAPPHIDYRSWNSGDKSEVKASFSQWIRHERIYVPDTKGGKSNVLYSGKLNPVVELGEK